LRDLAHAEAGRLSLRRGPVDLDRLLTRAVALFAETGAVGQRWLFWLAPLLGAAAGAAIWAGLLSDRPEDAAEIARVLRLENRARSAGGSRRRELR
jgi:hypothetical protein